ncbi:hypothetical protein HDU67_007047 [Dinochytrium kinnereticum]|nr:hypothetical protein HDU67_007047 [Dinochytrium kinnereticum]
MLSGLFGSQLPKDQEIDSAIDLNVPLPSTQPPPARPPPLTGFILFPKKSQQPSPEIPSRSTPTNTAASSSCLAAKPGKRRVIAVAANGDASNPVVFGSQCGVDEGGGLATVRGVKFCVPAVGLGGVDLSLKIPEPLQPQPGLADVNAPKYPILGADDATASLGADDATASLGADDATARSKADDATARSKADDATATRSKADDATASLGADDATARSKADDATASLGADDAAPRS